MLYFKRKGIIEVEKSAYEFALKKHDGQIRKSGASYIIHPLNVAYILVGIYSDYEIIAASLLHDVLSRTDCKEEEISKAFGKNIANLVQGVTKINKIHFSTENDYLID